MSTTAQSIAASVPFPAAERPEARPARRRRREPAPVVDRRTAPAGDRLLAAIALAGTLAMVFVFVVMFGHLLAS